MPDFTFNVISPGNVDINGSANTDFRLAFGNGTTIRLNSTGLTQMTVTDDDAAMSGDDGSNESAQDTSQQTTTITGATESAYIDYAYTVQDSAGNTYTIYVIDVGNSPDSTLGNNRAVTYIGFDADNPAPLDEDLTITGFQNVSSLPYDTLICFTPGTAIRVPGGEKMVEDLAVGDLVTTLDSGPRPIRWIGRKSVSALDLVLRPDLAPITVGRDAFGLGCPFRDTTFSPQHRILLEGIAPELMFGEPSVLGTCRHLVDDRGIRVSPVTGQVTYIHILLDSHEILFANGLPVESLLPGKQAMTALDAGERDEIAALFPELGETARPQMSPARRLLRGFETRALRNATRLAFGQATVNTVADIKAPSTPSPHSNGMPAHTGGRRVAGTRLSPTAGTRPVAVRKAS